MTAPAHGTAHAVANGSNDAYIAYTPATGYAGPDTFGYTISDGFGGFASAQVNLSVGSEFVVSVAISSNRCFINFRWEAVWLFRSTTLKIDGSMSR